MALTRAPVFTSNMPLVILTSLPTNLLLSMSVTFCAGMPEMAMVTSCGDALKLVLVSDTLNSCPKPE